MSKQEREPVMAAEEKAPAPMPMTLEALEQNARAATDERQKGTGMWKKARWVFHDKKAFESLVKQVCAPHAFL